MFLDFVIPLAFDKLGDLLKAIILVNTHLAYLYIVEVAKELRKRIRNV